MISKRLLAGLVVATMLVSGLGMVSFPATGEAVTGPFTTKNAGYPLPTPVLDQQQLNAVTPYIITMNDWAKQAFVAGTSGDLVQVSIFLNYLSGTGDIELEIWNTDQAGSHTSLITSETIQQGVIPVGGNWVSVDLSFPPTVSAGMEYAFILYGLTGTINVRGYYQISDPYPPANAYMSASGGAGWTPLSSNGDYAFMTFVLESTEFVDQSQTDNPSTITLSQTTRGYQSFVPGVTGTLTKVDVELYRSVAGSTLNVEVWSMTGTETNTLLASESVTNSALPTFPGGMFTVSFSSPTVVESGVQYGLVLAPQGSMQLVWKYYDLVSSYPDGEARISISGGAWQALAPPGDFVFRTYMVTPSSGLAKIAWHPNGRYALAVTGYDNRIYNYSRATGAWTFEGPQGVNNILTDIFYHPWYKKFYQVGRNSAGYATAWSYMAGMGIMLGSPTNTQGGHFYGIDMVDDNDDSGIIFIAVGQLDDGSALAAWYDGSWVMVDSGFSGTEKEKINDLTWNHRYTTSSKHYLVGKNQDTGSGIVYSLDLGSNIAALQSGSWGPVTPLNAIDWNPDWASNDYGIIVGEGPTHQGLKYAGGNSAPTYLRGTTGNLHDICWHPDGSLAVLVGASSDSNGLVFYHHAGSGEVVPMSALLPMDTTALYGVSVKGPTSPSSAIIVGSGGAVAAYPQASDTGTQMRVNTAFPHIFDIDMWYQGAGLFGPSMLNAEVDPGSAYTFYIEANYSIAGSDTWSDAELMLTAWYDNGAVGAASVPLDGGFSADDTRTREFRLCYNAFNKTAWMVYPATLPNEFGIIGTYEMPGAGDHHLVFINVTFGLQTYAADGNGFTFGPSGDILQNAQLFDANSWDFNYSVYDVNFTSAMAQAYEEFGIKRAVSISASGNPTGNAPPGTSNLVLSPSSLITYSSNTPYWVNVSIPDLLLNGVGPGSIGAINLDIQNTNAWASSDSDIGAWTTIPGAGSPLCVWGHAAGPTPLNPVQNGTQSAGPFVSDYTWISGGVYPDVTTMQWRITIPTVPEGTYWATITFSIEDN